MSMHSGPLRMTFAPPVWYGAAQFFSACCNIVFGSHGEPLGMYWRNGCPLSPFCGDKRLRFGCLGQVWHSGPLRMTFAPPVWYGAAQFFSACCNIVFGSHGKPLGIYWRNGCPLPPSTQICTLYTILVRFTFVYKKDTPDVFLRIPRTRDSCNDNLHTSKR